MDIDELIDLQWDLSNADAEVTGTCTPSLISCCPSSFLLCHDRSIHAGASSDTKRPLAEIDCNANPIQALNGGKLASRLAICSICLFIGIHPGSLTARGCARRCEKAACCSVS